MKKKTEQENPNHHTGKETGYELIDGEYHIAPLYQQQFDAIGHKEAGIRRMLEIVTSHAVGDLELLNEMRGKVWQALAADIGLDMTHNWTYHNGVVKELKKNDNQADR